MLITRVVRGSDYSPAIALSKEKDKLGQVMRKRVLCHMRAEQAGLNLTCSKIPEDTFSRDVAQLVTENWRDRTRTKQQDE